MFSNEVCDLTKITSDSNVAGAFKHAMKKALKNPVNGEYAINSKGYILNSEGNVLGFFACHSFPDDSNISKDDKIAQVLEELRHTPIEGKYYDLFDIENTHPSGFAITVMQKTVVSIIESNSKLNPAIASFWKNIRKSYTKNLLYRENIHGMNVLYGPRRNILVEAYFDIEPSKVDDFIKNKFIEILKDKIHEAGGNNFIYNRLVSVYCPWDESITITIYIQ